MSTRPNVFDNILDTIGNTPIVKLHRIPGNSPHTFYAKLESYNPGMSIKDRAALSIIDEAEARGDLQPGHTIIEATSGNTGLGLAMIAAVRGYKTILVMPDKVSEEKRAILRAYGARVVVCPTAVEPDDPRSYYKVCEKLVEITPNSFHANQYFNPDNVLAHVKTTAPEIWEQLGGELDYIVAGVGTGGTMSGIGQWFKEHHPEVKLIAPDPVGSILHDLFKYGEPKTPAHTYKIEGVGEDMLPGNVHFDVMDDFIKVTDEEAFSMCQDLVRREGICVGPSCAMAMVGALKYAETVAEPSTFLVVMPDTGRGYLSKAFNDDWLRENGFAKSPLTSRTVADLLQWRGTPGEIIRADVEDTVAEVAKRMRHHGISQVPVYSDGSIVGILDEGDLIMPLASGSLKPTDPIIEIIQGTLIWVDNEDSLQSLHDHLEQGYVALVRCPDGDDVRIVTKIDLLEYLQQAIG